MLLQSALSPFPARPSAAVYISCEKGRGALQLGVLVNRPEKGRDATSARAVQRPRPAHACDSNLATPSKPSDACANHKTLSAVLPVSVAAVWEGQGHLATRVLVDSAHAITKSKSRPAPLSCLRT